jgi:DTW domain-containing protein YfiP
VVQETDVIGECDTFERMVVLEGSWAKARRLLAHPALQPLRCVQLPRTSRSTFWCSSAAPLGLCVNAPSPQSP